ncbi:bifunctional folylpolyglutamate synthase/dihydrofolate synthase [Peribacillus sp. SCS-155]|uniref:bifunctional folylpolyglutamate synthase/dihydrofolate synthase n=1 Tax=Peribacillus sedimenti TaxID=3115297 RepID=UPI003906910A
MFKNINEVIDYLYNRESKLGMDFGLERMESILRKLGNPERRIRNIHIAGSNGKGSTLNAMKSILMEEGLIVGSFTSPHLVKVNERIMINDRMIPDGEIIELVNQLYPFLEEKGATYFEILTIMAFMYFEKSDVDVALIETGLGGRLDSTNVIVPLLSVITSISLEHTDFLGNTLGEIAGEKAGIIKKGIPVICGPVPDEAASVIKQKAISEDAPFYQFNDRFQLESINKLKTNQEITFRMDRTVLERVEVAMLGKHQAFNASLAIAAMLILNENYGFQITEAGIRNGLRKARWAGRFEIISEQPVIILDAAHNPDGVNVLLETLKDRYPDFAYNFVFTALRDKNFKKMIALLDEHANKMIFTKIQNDRAADAEELFAASTARDKDWEQDWKNAIRKGIAATGDDELLVITGSLYFLADAIPFLKKVEDIDKPWDKRII